MPKLWTTGRLLRLCGLLTIAVLQALAAIAAAVAAARLMIGSDPQRGTLAAGVIAGAVAVIALKVMQRRLAEQFALAYVKELRLALVSHVLRMPADGRTLRFGSVMTRVVNDFSAIRLWLASGLVSTLVAACILATIGTYLAITQPAVLLALSPALLLWLVVLALVWQPLDRRVADSRRLRGRIAASTGTMLRGRTTYLAFGRHGPLIRKLGRQTDRLNRALAGRATLSGLVRSSSDMVMPVTAVLIGLAGAAAGAELLGVLILATGIVVTQLNAMAMAVEYRLADRVAVTRLRAVFDRPALRLTDGASRLKRTGRGRRLQVDGLETATGRFLSFCAGKGERATVSGLTGDEIHGLFLTIAGLSTPKSGTVRLDGRAAAEISRRDWLRNVSLLSPTLPPIPGALLDSIALGSPSAISESERARLCARFGLTSADVQPTLREDGHLPHDTAGAIRAVRCLLRGASLVLVDDPDLLRNAALRRIFLEEIERRGTTLLMAPAETSFADSGRIIDLSHPDRQAA